MDVGVTEQVQDRKALFADVRRVVVKLGTRVVTVHDNELNLSLIDRLAADVAHLRARGVQVAVVSSGAVVAGMGRLALKRRPQRLAELQATAAVGQGLMMNAYKLAFRVHDIPVGQVLLTGDDLDNRSRYVNAHNTLDQLFRFGAVPIVNENDSVAVDELVSVGENDRLAALVTHLVDAQLLILFTDVDGLYSEDPGRNPDAQLIPFVQGVPKALYDRVGSAGSAVSRGGMRTKLRAAETVIQGGRMALIASGQARGIAEILAGENTGTLFVPGERSLSSREIWMAHSRSRGIVIVDDGAVDALSKRGKSLLPSGVVSVLGDFEAGDLIGVENTERREIARGMAQYGADDVRQVLGKQTSEAAVILNTHNGLEVIHRDDMVVF